MTEGLAYGASSTTAQREEDRYYHNKLGFTFAYPEDWTVDRGSKAIVTQADDGAPDHPDHQRKRQDQVGPRFPA